MQIPGGMPKTPGAAMQRGAEFLFGEVGMSHRFTVSIDMADYDLGSWSKVSGLSVKWEMCKYHCGDTDAIWIGPGVPNYTDVKLSRAASSESATVQNWLKDTLRKGLPLTGGIKMLDWMGTTMIEWKFRSFFPCGWSIIDFDAGGSKPAIETLDLAHTGFIDEWTY